MLKISVRDFRGCERADLQVSPIALVTGLNGAGKSSVLRAAAAAVTGRPMPAGLPKKDAEMMVRTGSAAGTVSVVAEGGACRASWPGADVQAEGTAPKASSFAAGIESVLLLDERERARVLAGYMKADPTRDDLADALRDAGLDDAQIGKAWDLVQAQGWDGAHEAAKADGAAAKREWERLTGEKYGSAKAGSWAPGIAQDLAGLSPDALAAMVQDLQQQADAAKAAQEKAIRADAAGAERLAQLKDEADRLERRKSDLQVRKSDADQAKAREEAARAELNALPPVPDHESVTSCPCCQAHLAVKVVGAGKYRLDAVQPVDEAEKAARAKAITEAQNKVTDAATLAQRLANEVRALEAGIKVSEKAKQDHADLVKQAQAIGATSSVDEARAAVVRAEGRLKAAQTKARADALHAEISQQTAVVKAFAPEGVRKRKLARALDAFNTKVLAPLCEAAEWKPVTLTEDLSAQYGGRAYVLLSDAEQYRVRVTLQVAMARLDGSALAIIDGADILDPAGRNGLFGMLADTELPALVGMTVASADKAPDLAAFDMGATYWAEDGQCRAIGAGQQGRAA